MTEPRPDYVAAIASVRRQRLMEECERARRAADALRQQVGDITIVALTTPADEAEQNRRYADVHDLRLRLEALAATAESAEVA